MTALTVGVTTPIAPDCKRGVAVNIAASLARNSALSDRICVVDADPIHLDVTTRLAVGGTSIEDFARVRVKGVATIPTYHSPEFSVLPSEGDQLARIHAGVENAHDVLRDAFDVVIYDLPGGPTGPGRVMGARLDKLDWLLLAVTPEKEAIAAAGHFIEMFETGRSRGEIGDVRLAVVCTGDESTVAFEPGEVEAILGVSTLGRIPQLWGRSQPNPGFGPALAIPELDDAVYEMLMAFRLDRDHQHQFATL
jgi:cellulose biosynthesis protein BcsQ